MTETLVVALAGLLIGLSKGGLGGPVPVSLTAPLLSLVMPVPQALGLILPLLLFADIFALYAYWRKWDMTLMRLLLPMAVVGVFMGTVMLATLSDDVLRRILGLFTLITIAYKVAGSSLMSVAYRPRAWHGYLAGWAAGLGSALANAGAPAFTAYMLLQPDVTPRTFVATSTLFFAVVNALKLPGYLTANIFDAALFMSFAWVLGVIVFGVWIGYTFIQWINPKVFEWLMLALLFAFGVALIFG